MDLEGKKGGGGERVIEGVILFGLENFLVFCANKAPLRRCFLWNFSSPSPPAFFLPYALLYFCPSFASICGLPFVFCK